MDLGNPAGGKLSKQNPEPVLSLGLDNRRMAKEILADPHYKFGEHLVK